MDRITHHVEKVRSKSISTSRTATIWFAALSIIWIFELEPSMQLLGPLQQAKESLAYVRDSWDSISSNDRIALEGSEPDYEFLMELSRERRATARDARSLAQEKVNDLRKKIKFTLPGLAVEVSPLYAPALWNLLALGLLVYLLGARRMALLEASRAIRLFKSTGLESDSDMQNMVGIRTWWLAPLPTLSGNHVSGDELRESMGWPPTDDRLKYVTIFILTAVLVVQLKVTWIGFHLREYFSAPDTWGYWLVPTISVSSTVLIGYVIYIWLKSDVVLDRFSYEANPFDRRRFLEATAVLLGSTFLSPVFQWLLLKRLREGKEPWIRKRTRLSAEVNLPAGFYVNRKSEIVHFVNNTHRIDGIGFINQDYLSSITLEELIEQGMKRRPRDENGKAQLLHLNFATACRVLEHQAIELLKVREPSSLGSEDGDVNSKDRRVERALNILDLAIKHDLYVKSRSGERVDYRIYDLLAGISVRHDRTDYLEGMIRLIRSSRFSGRFQHRLTKWAAKDNSDWKMKWKEKSLQWGANAI